MIIKIIPAFFLVLAPYPVLSQSKPDSILKLGSHTITLSEVVISNRLNIPLFIERIKNDSSFYKAFRNLRVLGFTAINDIRMNNKRGEAEATLHSITRQTRTENCRSMQVLEETATGNFYNKENQYNYYTAQMYASLFFTTGTVCGETNIVSGMEFDTGGKKGIQKHKEQLKMLFFNPGKKIKGIPLISNKTALFDEDLPQHYDMSIDMEQLNQQTCFVFRQKVKPGNEGAVVIDEMNTWFNEKTFEVMARNYSLSYNAGVYDFKVSMEVELNKFGDLLVPTLLRYHGNWKAIFKPRERGVFTATLSQFNHPLRNP